MKQITINGRVLGIPDVPGWASNFIIDDGDLFWEEHFTILPPGNWSILGRLNDITEEQAAQVLRGSKYYDSLDTLLALYNIDGNPLILLLNDKV